MNIGNILFNINIIKMSMNFFFFFEKKQEENNIHLKWFMEGLTNMITFKK